MLIHSGPVISFALLLVVSGVLKLKDPAPTSGALRVAALPSSTTTVFVLATAEILAGSTMVVVGGPIAGAAMLMLYTGFALFVLHALRKKLPISSCGCFGRADTPPSWIHVVVTGVAAAAGGLAVAMPLGPLGDLETEPLSVRLPFVAFVLTSVFLLHAVLAVLPRSQVRETPIALTPARNGGRT